MPRPSRFQPTDKANIEEQAQMRDRSPRPSRFQYRDIAGSPYQQANLFKIPIRADGSFSPTIKQPNITYTPALHNAVMAKAEELDGVLDDSHKYSVLKRIFKLTSYQIPKSTGGNLLLSTYTTAMIDFGDYLAVGHLAVLDNRYTYLSIQARKKSSLGRSYEWVVYLGNCYDLEGVLFEDGWLGHIHPLVGLTGNLTGQLTYIGVLWTGRPSETIYYKIKTIASGAEVEDTQVWANPPGQAGFIANDNAEGIFLSCGVTDDWEPRLFFVEPVQFFVNKFRAHTIRVRWQPELLVDQVSGEHTLPAVTGGYQYRGWAGNQLVNCNRALVTFQIGSGGNYTYWWYDPEEDDYESAGSSGSSVNPSPNLHNSMNYDTGTGHRNTGTGFNEHYPYFNTGGAYSKSVISRHSFLTNNLTPYSDPSTGTGDNGILLGVSSNGYSATVERNAGMTDRVQPLIAWTATDGNTISNAHAYHVQKANSQLIAHTLNVSGYSFTGNDVIVHADDVIGKLSDIYEGGVCSFTEST